MIEQLHIIDAATFRDEQLAGLQRVNIIYGANGSGKTTISKILNNPDIYPRCEITWQAGRPVDVLVYNKDFRETNLREDRLKGVFTLGIESAEKIEEINEKKRTLEQTQEKVKKLTDLHTTTINEIIALKSTFTENCWENNKDERNKELREAFTGTRSKMEVFATKVLEQHKNCTGGLKTYDELVRLAEVLFGSPPERCNELQLLLSEPLQRIETHEIWSKKILGKSDIEIAPLIQRLGMSDWINQGRKYIEEDSEVCPFCQRKTIDSKLRNQLEEYFDETFAADMRVLQSLSTNYQQTVDDILKATDERISQNQSVSRLDLSKMQSYIKQVELVYSANKEIISSKLKEPSRSFELGSISNLVVDINQIIDQANAAIKQHNSLVDNFKKSKNELVADVWKYIVVKNKALIDSYLKSLDEKDRLKDSLSTRIREHNDIIRNLSEEIREASKKITSVEASVDEINRLLSNYGFTTFHIAHAGGNYYKIQRENGDSAVHTLSEGEATFISFLYFMQQVKGSLSDEHVSSDRVVVIDDPVCSLDSGILHVVSSLIKGEMMRILDAHCSKHKVPYMVKQITILTHNVYFHKEVTNLKQQYRNKLHYWILRRKDKESKFTSHKENPIRGSYEMLWNECRTCDDRSVVSIQNIMRRIIETYFTIIGNFDYHAICDQMENNQDRDICRALVGWVNDGSHSISDDLYLTHGEYTVEHYQKVFKKFFECAGQMQHYNMMMHIDTTKQEGE